MSSPEPRQSLLHDRSLFSLAWPVSLTLAVGIAQPALDMFFLARVSDLAAAGVGAMIPVFAALTIVLNTLGQAGAAVAGQFLGARRPRLARATYAFLQMALVAIGIVLGIAMVALASPIAAAMGLTGEIRWHATLFLRILGCGMGARALWTSMINILASQGLTSWNLWGSVLALGSNAALNTLFLFGPRSVFDLGTFGVALATVLSWSIVSLVFLSAISRRLDYHPLWRDVALGWKRSLTPLIRIGLPATVEPISYQLFQVALASQVVRQGDTALKARVYAMTLANIPVIFSYGPGFAAQILTAHLVGGGREDEADRRLRKAAVWACAGALIVAVAVAATAPWSLRGFTADLAVLSLGARLLWVDVLLQPAKALNIAITFSLRAAGDSKFPAWVGSTLMWTAGLGLSLWLCRGVGWGVAGLWAGMAMDEWIRAVFNSWRWNSDRWRGLGVARA
jgi:putative MATE family efflux protein